MQVFSGNQQLSLSNLSGARSQGDTTRPRVRILRYEGTILAVCLAITTVHCCIQNSRVCHSEIFQKAILEICFEVIHRSLKLAFVHVEYVSCLQ